MIRIDVFHDLVCPWCYVGGHRLQRAIEANPDVVVEVRWRPFQLNPAMPRGGMDRTQYLVAKFGSAARARTMLDAVGAAVRNEGLAFAPDLIMRNPNTLDAHRLVEYAQEAGLGAALVARLYRAYFAEGADLGDRSILADLAEDVGLTQVEIDRILDGDVYRSFVIAADRQARRGGIQAIPCFVFDGRFAVAGAQEVEALQPFFDVMRAARQSA